MSDHSNNVGLNLYTDSAYDGAFRVNRDSALVTADGHARWYEQSSRGQVYAVFTALTGTVLAAANNAPPGAGSATVLTILNPVGSGVNLEILQGWVFYLSDGVNANPGAGFWAWCGAVAGVSITAAEAGTTKAAIRTDEAVTRVRAWSQAALTGGPAHANIRPFPMTQFSAVPGEIDQRAFVDNVDGAIVVLPGTIITLAPAARGGTNNIAGAGIMYAEVKRLLREAP